MQRAETKALGGSCPPSCLAGSPLRALQPAGRPLVTQPGPSAIGMNGPSAMLKGARGWWPREKCCQL